MKWMATALLLLVVLLGEGATAAALQDPHPTATRNGWKAEEEVETSPLYQPHPLQPHRRHTLRFALRQQNLESLERLFWEVSDPEHPSYGRFLSLQDLQRLISPPRSFSEKIISWIRSELLVEEGGSEGARGFEYRLSSLGDHLWVSLSPSQVERLFGVELAWFVRPAADDSDRFTAILRAKDESKLRPLPSPLSAIVEFVSGLTDFPPPLPPSHFYHRKNNNQNGERDVKDDQPGVDVTPHLIKKLYNITSSSENNKQETMLTSNYNKREALHANVSKQAVAEFQEAYFYPSDIRVFEKHFGLPLQPVARVIGINDPDSGFLGEASLDTQYIIGVGTGIETWVWEMLDFDLLEWAINVTETHPEAPLVHSISFGSAEEYYDQKYMSRVNTEFQKLGVLGYTITVASGDDGTGHSGMFWCGSFAPEFPASSPYVTAVGGTYFSKENNKEIGVSFSGGGFSNVFARPSYQQQAIDHFLQTSEKLPPQSYWNRSGRGIPDVSALATNYQVVMQGEWGGASGTSASSPVFAAIIALLNDLRFKANQPALGFVNPLLYKLALQKGIGTDVTQGNNKNDYCDEGFSAVAGWDPVTGLGTPSYSLLASFVR
ncbi:polynucleotide 3'-phosphatase [Balamuthia mandrillaris]